VTDPFETLKAAASSASGGAQRAADGGECLSSVPDDAPAPPARHSRLGVPSRFWVYRGADGREAFRVCRFDKEGGEKDVLPLTLWRFPDGLKWRWKGVPDPRPLYGLNRLSTRPDTPVLIVEGEKAADAAETLFPGWVAICWQGGSNAMNKADWSPLEGRRVAILPDADEPGRKAAKAIRGALIKLGVRAAGIVTLPDGLPKGWDVADAFPASFSLSECEKLIAAAIAQTEGPSTTADAAAEGWPAGFSMTPSGLWFQPRDAEAKAQWISGPFDVLGEARDSSGSGWSVVIRFKDRDGREKVEILPKAKLTTAGNEIRAHLVNEGLEMKRRSPNSGDPFADCLLAMRSTQRIMLCGATGWAGDSFVLPSEVISPVSGEAALFTGEAKALHFGRRGDLGGWRRDVASLAVGNTRAVFVISLALAGPLLKGLNMEGGGFHIRGGSSSGKSTLAMVAGSVWGGGGPLGFAQSWRATANGLESIAAGHSDTFLALDELGQLAPDEAGGAAYMIANGQAKARLKTDGTARARPNWRSLFLSTGEISLGDHIQAAKGGGNVMAGQELRVIDLKADAGAGLGAWDDIGAYPTGAAFSDALKAGAKAHYGHAGPEFVRVLLSDIDGMTAKAAAYEAEFKRMALRAGDTGQIERGVRRFALVAAAGRLAAEAGIVPWEPLAAFGAALHLFDTWAKGFGRTAAREETSVLKRLLGVLQREGSAFAASKEDFDDSMRSGEARSMTTYGFYGVQKGYKDTEESFYFIHRDGWERIFKGMDATQAAKIIKQRGYLTTDGGRYQKALKIKGRTQKLYWVSAAILEHDFADDLE
jgi:uncharacterized protein (DUF927 family)